MFALSLALNLIAASHFLRTWAAVATPMSCKQCRCFVVRCKLVSHSQTFRLTAESLESMAAFIGQWGPWGRLTDMSNNQSQFVSFSVTFQEVEMSQQWRHWNSWSVYTFVFHLHQTFSQRSMGWRLRLRLDVNGLHFLPTWEPLKMHDVFDGDASPNTQKLAERGGVSSSSLSFKETCNKMAYCELVFNKIKWV